MAQSCWLVIAPRRWSLRSSTAISTTAVRASSCRTPLSVRRSTGACDRARKPDTAWAAASGRTPGRTTRHSEACASPAEPFASSVTSSTSIPSGSIASSCSRTWSATRGLVSPMVRYSASLATPVGAPPAYEIFGCGVNPAEDAIGSPALRTPRSKARATSLWLAKRIFPRLAYRTTRCCTAGNCASLGSGSGTLPPDHYGKQSPPVEANSSRAHLDLGPHRRTDPAFITRSPAALFHLGYALGSDRVLPVLPEPVAVEACVEVVPGEHLTVITFARSIPCQVHRLPDQGRLSRAQPPLVGEVLAPPVETPAIPPRRQDHAAHSPVTAGEQALDLARPPVVIAEADGLAVGAVR